MLLDLDLGPLLTIFPKISNIQSFKRILNIQITILIPLLHSSLFFRQASQGKYNTKMFEVLVKMFVFERGP